MNEEMFERAFSSKRDKWTESQRRVVLQVEWLENALERAQTNLALFRKAAADEWLKEHLHND